MERNKIFDCKIFVILLLFLVIVSAVVINNGKSFDAIDPIRRTANSNMSENCNAKLLCDVKTRLGRIVGKEGKTILGDPGNVKFCSYRGIRFAEPPIGNLRFKPPVASGPWEGVLTASDYGPRCFYFSAQLDKIVGHMPWPTGEDCLFLNVFTPSPQICDCNTTNVPVLIFIYGGSFTEGSSIDQFYGPNIILNKCVILVTLNYRLGTFGFLSLRTPEYSGNMALKDQKLAIKWVKDNIDAFGGDPNRITIFGQSSGAASACYQAMNEESRRNFNQIYAISGTPLNYYAQMKSYNHTRTMVNLARRTGRKISNYADLIEFIKNVDARDILRYTSHVGVYGFTFDTDWAPIVERPGDIEAIITQDPLEYYETHVNDMPMIFSHVTLEYFPFLLLYFTSPLDLITKNNQTLFLPYRDLDQDSCAEEVRPLVSDIKKFYFGGMNIDVDSFRQFIRMTSDMNFAYHIQKTVALLSKTSRAPIGFQIHNQRTPLNILSSLPVIKSLGGTGHAEDVCYYFYCRSSRSIYADINKYRNFYETYMEANLVINVLTELLVNYATNGNPTSETAAFNDYPAVGPNPYKRQNYVEITNTGTPVVGLNPNWNSFNLWTQIDKKIDEIRKLPCNYKYNNNNGQ